MQAYCRNACTYLTNQFEKVQQGLLTTIVEVNEVRLDPEGFQRICLVALSILEGINYYSGHVYLPHLVKILDVANSLDFYGFLKIPYHLFHSINPDKVDEFRTQQQLEHLLCVNWNIGHISQDGFRQHQAIHDFSKHCLARFLDQMSTHDLACIDDAKFSQLLQKWIIDERRAFPEQLPDTWLASQVDLQNLKVIQKDDSWLENLSDLTFLVVDVICVPTFLRDFNLIDLASYANKLGKFRVLSWVPGQSLDTWVRGGLCLGFLLRFLEASRSIRYDRLGESSQKRAYWELAISISEFVFNFSAFCQAKVPVVIFLTFIAKSIGVASLVYRPNVHYFETHPSVEANEFLAV